MLLNGRIDKERSNPSGNGPKDRTPWEDIRGRDGTWSQPLPPGHPFPGWEEDEESIEPYPTIH